MKKKWLIIFVVTVLFGSLLGYFYKAFIEKKPTVAVVLKGSKSEYWAILASGIEKGFENFGVKGKIYAPDQNHGDQIVLLKKVLKEKPDALIFSPLNPSVSIPLLKEFEKKHIPVLLVDTGADWPGQTSFIGTYNPGLGEKAGELLASMLQPGDKVALVGKISKDSVSEDRIRGAEEALHEVRINTVAGNIQVVDDNSKVIPVIAKLLKNHPDIKGFFATDDGMALEVIKYLNEKGLNLPVVGADGIIEIVEFVENGTLKASVAQNPYDMGYISVENALKAINGQTVETKINSDVDIITKDNAKSKIDFLEGILKN